MNRSKLMEANRLAWNAAAPRHEKVLFSRLIEGFKRPGYNSMDSLKTLFSLPPDHFDGYRIRSFAPLTALWANNTRLRS